MEKKKVNQTPMAWERTLWSWRLLSTAGRWGEQAHGTGLVLGRPHDGRHGNLLPRSGWCRWMRMVGGFPVSSWGESSATSFDQLCHQAAWANGLPQAVFQGSHTKRTWHCTKSATPRMPWIFQVLGVWTESSQAINIDAELVLNNLLGMGPSTA